MNALVGLLSLTAVVFITTSTEVPDALRPGAVSAAFSGFTAGFLVVSSVLALLGKPRSLWLALAAALIHYGMIAGQNVYFLFALDGDLVPASKLTANAVRSGIEIAINLWGLLSAKSRAYFDVAPGASSSSSLPAPDRANQP